MPAFLDKIPWWIALALLGVALPHGAASRRSAPRAPTPSVITKIRFVRCHDGDTCTGKTPEGLLIQLRLLGLDAPEVAPPGSFRRRRSSPPQPYALSSRDELCRRVVGRILPVEIRGSDPYRRYLAIVWDGTRPSGVSINESLIREGYAFAYRAKFVDSDIRRWAESAELGAQRDRRGLWGTQEKPLNPSEYRRLMR